MMHTDSRFGRVYLILLHIFALSGLLTVFFYAVKPNSKWVPRVPTKESKPATLDQIAKVSSAADQEEIISTEWIFNASRDGENLGLSEEQCNAAFPKQYNDIKNNVANLISSPITLADLDKQDQHDQRIRAIIYDGDLYIISKAGGMWVQNGVATVHALQRALAAFPDRKNLPNIEFFIYAADRVGKNEAVWTYTKPVHETDFRNQWLIPDFGYWAWPHARIPSYNHILKEIRRVEDQVHFEDKTPQLLWRGNKNTAPERPLFLKATDGKDWANASSRTYLTLWDHCRFKMVMDISGVSWSGKGKYIQNCESVYVTHTPKWLKTTTYALEADGPEQNFVQVKEDWSDLEEKVKEVLENPSLAERIAKKGVEDMRDRYLTPAAQACYWRALIRGYGSVSFEPNMYERDGTTLRGVPFETVALSPSMDLKKWWDF